MKKNLLTFMTALAMSGSLLAAPSVPAASGDQLQLRAQTCVDFVDINQDGICDSCLDHEPLLKQDGTGGTQSGSGMRRRKWSKMNSLTGIMAPSIPTTA